MWVALAAVNLPWLRMVELPTHKILITWGMVQMALGESYINGNGSLSNDNGSSSNEHQYRCTSI